MLNSGVLTVNEISRVHENLAVRAFRQLRDVIVGLESSDVPSSLGLTRYLWCAAAMLPSHRRMPFR